MRWGKGGQDRTLQQEMARQGQAATFPFDAQTQASKREVVDWIRRGNRHRGRRQVPKRRSTPQLRS